MTWLRRRIRSQESDLFRPSLGPDTEKFILGRFARSVAIDLGPGIRPRTVERYVKALANFRNPENWLGEAQVRASEVYAGFIGDLAFEALNHVAGDDLNFKQIQAGFGEVDTDYFGDARQLGKILLNGVDIYEATNGQYEIGDKMLAFPEASAVGVVATLCSAEVTLATSRMFGMRLVEAADEWMPQ